MVCTIQRRGVSGSGRRGLAFVGGLNELRNVTYVDFPACHWSMWTHPREVGAIIAGFAGDVG